MALNTALSDDTLVLLLLIKGRALALYHLYLPCRSPTIIVFVYTLMSVTFYLMNGRSDLFSAISHILIVVILDLCTLLCIVVDVQSILDTAIETMRGKGRSA